jgi:erythromycin esterase-like protein
MDRTIESPDPQRLRALVQPLEGGSSDVNPVLETCANARYVLLGEATHGTHEFYRMRAQITKRLIERHGFSGVAIEGDWPDANRVHRYVCGSDGDASALEALGAFDRFPIWMWRNADVLDFVGWLRTHNDALPPERKAGFYGLDLYSMYRSMAAVITYLESVDPRAAECAKERYGCFDRFGADVEQYARSVGSGLSKSCRDESLAQLLEMQQRTFARASADAANEAERRFVAKQNARVVAGAEAYYRTMLDAEVSSWNMRDTFMYSTLEGLSEHLSQSSSGPAKIVIWAHNSHVGDARATTLGGGRELNLGQLVRERQDCRLIGFTTSTGTVTAASQWHAGAERKRVREPVGGSWEALFHAVGIPNFYLDLQAAAPEYPALAAPLLERAIGVLYLPQTELHSHYLYARIARQFDAIFHLDRTRAVEPLDRDVRWETGEVPETYPTAI